jgi:carbon monoxide dehydrogenase subunit G
MKVVLDKQYPVAARVEAAWTVLANMNELATCMPGAQITEEIDATHFKGAVKVKVGPAVAAFAGTIEILTLDRETRTLKMMGKGADKGGSSASMELTATLLPAESGHCILQGHAEVIVNGKFAQFGGRLMTSVSDMILAQFADVFSQKAQVVQAGMAPAIGEAGASGGASGTSSGDTTAAASVPVVPTVAKEFNALAFVWLMIKNFFTGRKS